ncbi:MAG: hypothetical protein OXF96_02565 [Chloroflexi bacterium]|nr:hypothetical protein [Chloroflexota bacterium]
MSAADTGIGSGVVMGRILDCARLKDAPHVAGTPPTDDMELLVHSLLTT